MKRIENSLKYAMKIYPKVLESIEDPSEHPLDPMDFLRINIASNNMIVDQWKAYKKAVREELVTDNMVSHVQKDGSITFHYKGKDYENNRHDVVPLDEETQKKFDTYQMFRETLIFDYLELMTDAAEFIYKEGTKFDEINDLEKKLQADLDDYDDWVERTKDIPADAKLDDGSEVVSVIVPGGV